ncbi:MAG: GNAT family N-acetyltransferase [Candidatus Cloacimonadota bacterium]|nr:MAG: GNAT family N-acetyltransferase [Candidatus Cloacimonadota bacterium]
MLNHVIRFLDENWALSLGCSAIQLKDGDQHVVASPKSTGDINRPYPLKFNSICMITFGTGWVLSVPSNLIETANALCIGLSFSDIAKEGDILLNEWYLKLGTADEIERPKAMAYSTLVKLAQSLNIRGWSHYYHWYCDPSNWNSQRLNKCVSVTQENDLRRWEQWLSWPGPFCQAKFDKYFEISDAFGYFLNGQLVSVAQIQANHKDFAWEFGVDTLSKYRGRGYATEVCRGVVKHIIEHNRIPWYYYDHYNHASERIPQKLGFFLYFEGLFSHSA